MNLVLIKTTIEQDFFLPYLEVVFDNFYSKQ